MLEQFIVIRFCQTEQRNIFEWESGVEVLIVNNEGMGQVLQEDVSEDRDEALKVDSSRNHEFGSVIVQNAETIRLVSKDKKLIPLQR